MGTDKNVVIVGEREGGWRWKTVWGLNGNRKCNKKCKETES